VNLVFVYGTLLKGQANNHLMGESRMLYKACTLEDFVMFGRGFPLARPAEEEDSDEFVGRVAGEVWEVSDSVLPRLDRLEGHPNFYRRTPTPIALFSGDKVEMYHWVSGRSVVGEQHKPDSNGVLYWPESVRRLNVSERVKHG